MEGTQKADACVPFFVMATRKMEAVLARASI